MKKYLAQLRPLERRLVVGVGVVLLVVLNWAFIWPHFGDWSDYRTRRDNAAIKLRNYRAAVAQIPELQKQLKVFESEGDIVAPEDQAVNLMSTIQAQSAQSGVGLLNASKTTSNTNDVFFVKQIQNINVLATEEQLVNFLYRLGSSSSMIRVRDLTMQPDAPHQRLAADIRLEASYQKNPSLASAAKSATAKAK
jgi:Tfp pilus assembly protein PilO